MKFLRPIEYSRDSQISKVPFDICIVFKVNRQQDPVTKEACLEILFWNYKVKSKLNFKAVL
jgi:hypothetical protein